MELLDNAVQEYAWGSRTAIAELLGRPSPAERPQAELWMGAHPSAPSKVKREGQWVSLLEVIGRAPDAELGPEVQRRLGPRLPFLLKVLAAEQPLSLQAHPSAAQAKAGFAREEAAGLPRTAPHRDYKDDSHKPELLCALTPFEALCGFRGAGETLRLLEGLEVAELAPLLARLRARPNGQGLREVLEALLGMPQQPRAALVHAALQACERLSGGGGEFAAELGWAVRLGKLYPGDAGAISALLLNLVTLQPGEAIFLAAGCLHAYLSGVGIEIMANSDNVLRGGLTPKHVDVPELLSVLDFQDRPVSVIRPARGADGEQRYVTPAAEFRLSRISVIGGQGFGAVPRGPEILLCTAGTLTVRGAGGEVALPRGASVWISASDGAYELVGDGTVFRAAVGLG